MVSPSQALSDNNRGKEEEGRLKSAVSTTNMLMH